MAQCASLLQSLKTKGLHKMRQSFYPAWLAYVWTISSVIPLAGEITRVTLTPHALSDVFSNRVNAIWLPVQAAWRATESSLT